MIKSKFLQQEDDDDADMDSLAKVQIDKEALIENIVSCFAALTEKLEDARTEFALNEPAVIGLIKVIG